MEKDFEQQPWGGKRIAFIGPECTGKTTLSQTMASQYGTQWVEEYMRTYLQKKWDESKEVCSWGDLLPIAQGQIALENEKAKTAKDFLFCDTCLLELVIYSYIYYGKCEPLIEKYALRHRYDFFFLTYIDVPWQADDLRDKPFEREEIFTFFKGFLEEKNIPFKILKGSVTNRIKNINQMLTQ